MLPALLLTLAAAAAAAPDAPLPTLFARVRVSADGEIIAAEFRHPPAPELETELRRRMARRAADAGLETVSAGFDNSASETHRQAQSIRTLLFGRDTPEPPPPPAENSVKASSRKPSDGKRKSAKNRERGTRGRGMKIRRAS